MKREIERRFLVRGEAWREAPAVVLEQTYLHAEAACTVRVRREAEQAWLTIKGPTHGASRDEFEYAIPVEDATRLMRLAATGLVRKLRRRVTVHGDTWDVDEFLDDNAPLVLAEIELNHEDQHIVRPDWLGDEVTHDTRYSNARLAVHPYSRW